MPEIRIMTFLFFAVVIACSSAFLILFIGKTGIRNFVISISPKLISELFDCDFCLSFWSSLILAAALAIIFSDMSLVFAPIVSTPIARHLL